MYNSLTNFYCLIINQLIFPQNIITFVHFVKQILQISVFLVFLQSQLV